MKKIKIKELKQSTMCSKNFTSKYQKNHCKLKNAFNIICISTLLSTKTEEFKNLLSKE